MKQILSVLSAVGIAIALPVTVFAATFAGGEMYNLSGEEAVLDNLHAVGGDVTIGGAIEGDLTAAGGVVTVTGPVRDDVLMAGGDLSVLGSVGEDARIVGGNLLIGSQIGGDLLAAGGTVKMLDNTTVGKDLAVAGGLLMIDGTIAGDVTMFGGEIYLSGIIGGDVYIEVDEKLTIAPGTTINGALVYKGRSEEVLILEEGAVVAGGVTFEESKWAGIDYEQTEEKFAGTFMLIKAIMTGIAALALVLLMARPSQRIVTTGFDEFWMNMLRGFVVLVVSPILMILLAVSMVGGLLALLLLFSYIALLIVSSVYSGVILGSIIIRYAKKGAQRLVWWHALLGVAVLHIVGSLPLVGWIVCLGFMLVAIGTITTLAHRKLVKKV